MKQFKPFEEIAVPGKNLLLRLGRIPENFHFDGKGQRVAQLSFTHGVISEEEIAFHFRDVLSDENFARVQRNEEVVQILESHGKRYRITACLIPLTLCIEQFL